MKITGFYYDQQLNDPFMSIAMYPNMEPTDKYKAIIDTEFKQASSAQTQTGKNTNVNSTSEVDTPKPEELWRKVSEVNEDSDSEGSFPYGKKSIARAILNEDFQVSIANSWTGTGGDPIGQTFNSYKGLAPYLAAFSKELQKIGDTTKEFEKNNKGSYKGIGDSLAGFLGTIAGNYGKSLGGISKLLNRSLVVQGTSFVYYGGTGVDFGNLGLKYTIFPTYDSKGNFISVMDQLADVLPYCIGPYIPVDLKELSEKISDSDITNFVKEFASWQLPPGGFEPDMKSIDVVQKGTLKLTIGSFYTITNLVIANCQFNLSKQMIKDPTKEPGATGYLTPMYCDANLTLKPATKYSYNSLLKFAKGRGTEKLRAALDKEIGSSYKNVRSSYTELDYKYV